MVCSQDHNENVCFSLSFQFILGCNQNLMFVQHMVKCDFAPTCGSLTKALYRKQTKQELSGLKIMAVWRYHWVPPAVTCSQSLLFGVNPLNPT